MNGISFSCKNSLGQCATSYNIPMTVIEFSHLTTLWASESRRSSSGAHYYNIIGITVFGMSDVPFPLTSILSANDIDLAESCEMGRNIILGLDAQDGIGFGDGDVEDW
eukprot:10961673-Karenia_brevis.AAC.1